MYYAAWEVKGKKKFYRGQVLVMLLSTESQHQEDKWRNEQEAPIMRESREAQLAPDSFYWNMYKTFNFKKTKYYL